MTVKRNHWWVILPLAVSVAAFIGGAALAGPWSRDAGSKMRGDLGPPSVSRPAAPALGAPAAERVVRAPSERRVFTFAPNPYKAGDKVVVAAEGTRLMLGTTALAEVPKGTELKVIATEGPWVGARIDKDGKTVGGWILMDRVQAAAKKAAAAPPPADGVRRFSAEPGQPIAARGAGTARPPAASYYRADSKMKGRVGL